ncbi:MAG TPA: indole-3-glycerol phosphate synthase TrpC [Clostridiales bacterium]|nr:indole-3-glycerol phosphate synthase TrpC [Clostridiales bacterium]
MILDDLAAEARLRVEQSKARVAPEQMERAARKLAGQERIQAGQERTLTGAGFGAGSEFGAGAGFGFAFEQALRQPGIQFICEVKKASPSKGQIVPDEAFRYMDIAREYEEAGAAAVSVLTEPKYFLGSDRYLAEIVQAVSIPVLRKDFTVDAFQIHEAKVLGAAAVLLICALLDTGILREYIGICDQLGLSALVEAHDEREIESALAAGARVVGVNNRNLKDFTMDPERSIRLRERVPKEILYVAESGIQTALDVERLCSAGVNGVLIGETLMRSPDKKKMLDELRGERR